MSLDAARRANQHHMLRHIVILIQDMGTDIGLRQNGNRRASALPASEKRVIAESIGYTARVHYWPSADIQLAPPNVRFELTVPSGGNHGTEKVS